MHGRLDEHVIASEALRGNPLGDPHERPLWVYVPPGYDDEPERRYPSVYAIQGMTGQVDMWRNRASMRKTVIELFDELFASGEAPPCLVVFPDCFTALGGSQFLDSPAVGRYHTYLCDEVVPWVDERYRTLDAAAHRGIMGKSSGGYGAMVTPMLRPDLFGGLATHAGDALFELLLPARVRAVRAGAARGVRRLVRALLGGLPLAAGAHPRVRQVARQHLLHGRVLLGGRAAVRPRDRRELRPDVFARWLEWDPVLMVAAPRRDAARAEGRLHRLRRRRTTTTSTSARSRSAARSPRSASPTSSSSSSPPRTQGSSTATRSRSATSPSGSRRRHHRRHPGVRPANNTVARVEARDARREPPQAA